MNTQSNKPIDTLRDGAIKATIWKNPIKNGAEQGVFYSVDFSRTYRDEAGNYHDSHSFSGTEPLQIARLATVAYDRIAELRRVDARSDKHQPA